MSIDKRRADEYRNRALLHGIQIPEVGSGDPEDQEDDLSPEQQEAADRALKAAIARKIKEKRPNG